MGKNYVPPHRNKYAEEAEIEKKKRKSPNACNKQGKHGDNRLQLPDETSRYKGRTFRRGRKR